MKITQEAREAASALCEHPDSGLPSWLAECIRKGDGDGLAIVQAIAAAEARGRKGTAKDCPVEYATVRDGGDEWHIECRFRDGQKFAAVMVEKDHEDLADWIAAIINAVEDK